MKVVKKRLEELRRPERNVRMHTDKQLKEFRRSVEMFGQIRPIVVDEGGVILADNRVFDLGVDDLAALDAFVLELKDDLDIPGFEEDLLLAMVMEADEASDTLREYGTIDPEKAEEIRETGERYEANEEAAAGKAEEYTPAAAAGGQPPQAEQTHRYVLCPKCGERIWL